MSDDIRARAEAGEAEAQFRLGMMYLHGQGVEADGPEGTKWIGRAAAAEHPEALRVFGWHLLADEDPNLVRQGREQLERAHALGNPSAAALLASAYAAGKYLPRHDVYGLLWLQRAVMAHPTAENFLAFGLFFIHLGQLFDAMPFLERAHALGEPQAALRLRQVRDHLSAQGIAPDPEAHAQEQLKQVLASPRPGWAANVAALEAAAQGGAMLADALLISIHNLGLAGKMDPPRAMQAMRESVSRGHPQFIRSLALRYVFGVEPDKGKAEAEEILRHDPEISAEAGAHFVAKAWSDRFGP